MNSPLGDDLLLTAARLNRWATRHAQLPAPGGQLRLLALIESVGPARIGDLAAWDNCSQPTMTTQVQRLERLGLVSRGRDDRDARATVVQMTDAGRQALEESRRMRAEVVEPLLADMSQEELDVIARATQILQDRLAKQTALEAPHLAAALGDDVF